MQRGRRWKLRETPCHLGVTPWPIECARPQENPAATGGRNDEGVPGVPLIASATELKAPGKQNQADTELHRGNTEFHGAKTRQGWSCLRNGVSVAVAEAPSLGCMIRRFEARIYNPAR